MLLTLEDVFSYLKETTEFELEFVERQMFDNDYVLLVSIPSEAKKLLWNPIIEHTSLYVMNYKDVVRYNPEQKEQFLISSVKFYRDYSSDTQKTKTLKDIRQYIIRDLPYNDVAIPQLLQRHIREYLPERLYVLWQDIQINGIPQFFPAIQILYRPEFIETRRQFNITEKTVTIRFSRIDNVNITVTYNSATESYTETFDHISGTPDYIRDIIQSIAQFASSCMSDPRANYVGCTVEECVSLLNKRIEHLESQL